MSEKRPVICKAAMTVPHQIMSCPLIGHYSEGILRVVPTAEVTEKRLLIIGPEGHSLERPLRILKTWLVSDRVSRAKVLLITGQKVAKDSLCSASSRVVYCPEQY